jgi:DNA-directed RNA polymerase I, II, and III subunit RPABC2
MSGHLNLEDDDEYESAASESEDESNLDDDEEQEIDQDIVIDEEEPDQEDEDDGDLGKGASDDDDDDPGESAINPLAPILDSDDDEDELDEAYLQKFNTAINKNYISDFHPECSINNYDEITTLTKIVRDSANNIIDDLHKTIPYLTKYERARVLGQRAKQISSGAKVFIRIPENIIDGYLIAELELAQKRIPFIIRRPTPGGGCEYWNLKDLELIQF